MNSLDSNKCANCRGAGVRPFGRHGNLLLRECPVCDGAGTVQPRSEAWDDDHEIKASAAREKLQSC